MRETSIALTPVGEGRFEVYLDSEKVYDRKEAGEGDLYNGRRVLRQVRTKLTERLEAVGAPA